MRLPRREEHAPRNDMVRNDIVTMTWNLKKDQSDGKKKINHGK
jgi:hypothetical protein